MNFLDFIRNNIGHVFPLLIAAVFAIAIAVERSRALFVTYPIKNTKGFFDRLQEFILGGNITGAIALCDEHSGKPMARIVKSALTRAHLPDEAIEQGVVLALGEENRKIQKRTQFLSTIANVSTLLGLFGTIAGLVQSFQAVESADPQMKSKLLASGIATAMNATMMGLGIAIPCMVLFSVLVNRSNRLAGEYEDSAMRTVDILKMRYLAQDPSEYLSAPPSEAHGSNGIAHKVPERRAG